ncbi:hypothetical protein [Prosthecomicrobium sp. N25]|uniref:hypothetical protein n=1 Tax=Prosthecomicrobium sp. N25 TaxID=3129254 RepID=UPI003077F75F
MTSAPFAPMMWVEPGMSNWAYRDRVSYPRWANEDHIEPVPGSAVDFNQVEQCIRDLCDRFDVRDFAFDPQLGPQMLTGLQEDGFLVTAMRQVLTAAMSAPPA